MTHPVAVRAWSSTRATEVVITGVGPVSALGRGRSAFWSGLVEGRSGLRSVRADDPASGACTVAADVSDPPRRPWSTTNQTSRAAELASFAAELGWADSGLGTDVNMDRVGVAVGCGAGNLDVIESAIGRMLQGKRLPPLTAFHAFTHASALAIVDVIGATGPITTVSTGCTSGLDAVAVAVDWIRLGRADVVVAAGTEAELVPFFLTAMNSGLGLSREWSGSPEGASRPFDARRSGNVPGEGAGVIVLESRAHAARRGADILARIASVASISAARSPHRVGTPKADPSPLVRSMRLALEQADVDVQAISSICANGSSSVAYDPIEAAAYRELLGARARLVPIYSVKGALGQTGACSPIFQLMAAALSIREGLLPPTLNHEEPERDLGIQVVTRKRAWTSSAVLVHAIGSGGAYSATAVLSDSEGRGGDEAR